jgi:hypothetical protein
MRCSVATGKLGGGFPGPIVGHRTFDREDAAVVVGDDQDERLGWVGVIGGEQLLRLILISSRMRPSNRSALMGQVVHLAVPPAAYSETIHSLEESERIFVQALRGWVATVRAKIRCPTCARSCAQLTLMTQRSPLTS